MTWADAVYALWAAVALGAGVAWLAARHGWRIGGWAVDTPSAALARLLLHGPARWVLVAGWIWVGVHTFAR